MDNVLGIVVWLIFCNECGQESWKSERVTELMKTCATKTVNEVLSKVEASVIIEGRKILKTCKTRSQARP